LRVVEKTINHNIYVQDEILRGIEIERAELETFAYNEAEKMRRIQMERLEDERMR
jgi:hypothetical protein